MCTHLPTIGGSVATTRHQYWWTYTLLLTYTSLYPTPGPITLPPWTYILPSLRPIPYFPWTYILPSPRSIPFIPYFPSGPKPYPWPYTLPLLWTYTLPLVDIKSLTDSCKTLPSRNYCCGRLISDTFEIICFLSFKTNKAAMDSTN